MENERDHQNLPNRRDYKTSLNVYTLSLSQLNQMNFIRTHVTCEYSETTKNKVLYKNSSFELHSSTRRDKNIVGHFVRDSSSHNLQMQDERTTLDNNFCTTLK